MKVIDPGHVYTLETLDGEVRTAEIPQGVALVFVKREGPGYPGNVGHHPGTNLQEVIRVLLDRVKYLDGQIHHENNALIVANLRHSLWLLEERAAERHGRSFAHVPVHGIECFGTCSQCGHVGCDGRCRSHV